jgi:hypothetical protein
MPRLVSAKYPLFLMGYLFEGLIGSPGEKTKGDEKIRLYLAS